MSDYKATVTDMRMSMINRGYTEAQVSELLGSIKAEAWDAAYQQGRTDQSNHSMYNRCYTENPYRKDDTK